MNPSQPSLLSAAKDGDASAAQLLLLENKINPNNLSSIGRTPLSWAAERGHEAVVEILLRDARTNPDTKDFYRTVAERTALETADADWEFNRKVDLDSEETNYRTPLSRAAENGHVEVVKLLLQDGRVNPDMHDSQGRTALSWAMGKGHQDVVRLFLGDGRADPNYQVSKGENAAIARCRKRP
ncbi:hypothetical protein AWENTII_002203 [Aspergillus wentii]